LELGIGQNLLYREDIVCYELFISFEVSTVS